MPPASGIRPQMPSSQCVTIPSSFWNPQGSGLVRGGRGGGGGTPPIDPQGRVFRGRESMVQFIFVGLSSLPWLRGYWCGDVVVAATFLQTCRSVVMGGKVFVFFGGG